MFSLWYALLSWKEYKTSLLSTVQKTQNPVEEPVLTPELPKVIPETVDFADSNRNKTPFSPVPNAIYNSTPRSIPNPQNTIIETSFPGPMKPSPKSPLDPPPKPPRSPSPHPMRSEAFDDIEFDTEDSGEEEEEEDEEQNSVIDSTVIEQKRAASNVQEFLTGEITNLEKDSS